MYACTCLCNNPISKHDVTLCSSLRIKSYLKMLSVRCSTSSLLHASHSKCNCRHSKLKKDSQLDASRSQSSLTCLAHALNLATSLGLALCSLWHLSPSWNDLHLHCQQSSLYSTQSEATYSSLSFPTPPSSINNIFLLPNSHFKCIFLQVVLF